MKFGMYALLIISGYVIGLCFAVQGFKFTSNAKYRQNFSFVYMTKIKKLHISLCNKSKCGKCKITHKVLDSFPVFVQISSENSLSIVQLILSACQWPRS